MNPLLALHVAEHVRNEVREHPKRWGCLALFLLFGPATACVLVAVLIIVVIAGGADGSSSTPGHVPGIPDIMLTAYHQAAQRIGGIRPACAGMRWTILAGIAEVESRHASGRTIAPNGDISPPILGPPLDGSGVGGNRTPIRNPDGTFARAVGPFQFLTTTWASVEQDGNDDGVRNPHNAFDAALGAAAYLCGIGPRDLKNQGQLRAALLRYNASQAYVAQVLANIERYDAVELQPPVNASGAAKAVIDAAMSQLGVPYAWGGGTAAGPSRGIRDGGVADRHGDYNKIGFDCSGLVLFAYAKVGITLPHNSRAQFVLGTRVPKEAGLHSLYPGDLVFYSPGLIHHVGIYVGDKKMINAPYSGSEVRIDEIVLDEYAGGSRLMR
ncbi:NlpC/P60 family protein [Amycolatopsis roodepoortensis]|uniref:C40 family peptidase n=1 Tax=Amycolatopsis roodepoortensis TaxID=700274 RepID=UPI00214BDA7A|nr:C40 family peptidase [Amycolatopsis roodepoortensis]UUV29885.1 NlpC/P60 family protein [Amycolatopsis roodepoortensis]